MLMGHFRTWLIIFLLLAPTTEPVSAADGPPTAEQIATWVRDLDHERFAVRNKATANLVKAGVPAVEALGRATVSPSPEVADRAFRALRELVMSADPRIRREAERLLTALAASDNRQAAAGARWVLLAPLLKVVAELEAGGATVRF